jgi:hypothetical protein
MEALKPDIEEEGQVAGEEKQLLAVSEAAKQTSSLAAMQPSCRAAKQPSSQAAKTLAAKQLNSSALQDAAVALLQMMDGAAGTSQVVATKPIAKKKAGKVKANLVAPKLTIHKVGSGRQIRRYIAAFAGGIPKMLPSTDAPITGIAEMSLFAELLPLYTSKGGKMDYSGMRAAWNLRFLSQVMPGEVHNGGKPEPMIYSKSVRHLKAYHKQVDRISRVRENHAFVAIAESAPFSQQVAGKQSTMDAWVTKPAVTSQQPAAVAGAGRKRVLVSPVGSPSQSSAAKMQRLQQQEQEGAASPSQPSAARGQRVQQQEQEGAASPSQPSAARGQRVQQQEQPQPAQNLLSMMASWAGFGAGPNNIQLHQEAGPSNSQLQQEAPAAAAGTCYICKRCLLLASFVRLKSDHPRGGCPGVGTAEELKLAEKGAKQLMLWGSNKNFDNKVYVSFLKSNKPEEFSKLEFSEGAEPDGNELNVFCFCSKVISLMSSH